MNVVQNNIDSLNLELSLSIEAADYAELLRKKLADCKRKAEFKGFRKGMAPLSLIKRVYGDQCLAEAVNTLVSEGLGKHIEDNGLKLLGEPITSEKQPELKWEDGENFTFLFDAALQPTVDFEVDKSDTVPSYVIAPSEKEKADRLEGMKKINDEKPEGEEKLSDEDIEKNAAQSLENQYLNESSWRLDKDIRAFYVAKAALEIPEEFLKRWLYVANEAKLSKEDIDKDFPNFLEDFKWQLVRSFLMKKFELKVEEADIRSAAEGFVRYQYAMYGVSDLPTEILQESIVNLLQNQKQVERLAESVEDQKVISKLKEIMVLSPTDISSEDFRNL